MKHASSTFRLRMRGRLILVAALALPIAGCGFGEAREDAKRTEAAIKTALGVDANVTFRVISGTGGRKIFVTVRLKSTPPGDAAGIKSHVDEIVEKTFRSHVDGISVAL